MVIVTTVDATHDEYYSAMELGSDVLTENLDHRRSKMSSHSGCRKKNGQEMYRRVQLSVRDSLLPLKNSWPKSR